jgi:putative transposase
MIDSAIIQDSIWVEARSRAAILTRTLPDAPADRRLSVAEAARELGVDRSTVFRWRARFEPERRLSALLPRRRGRPKGHCQVDPRVEELLETQITTFYLRPERPSIRELEGRIHSECDRIGVPQPNSLYRAQPRSYARLSGPHAAASVAARRDTATATAHAWIPVLAPT